MFIKNSKEALEPINYFQSAPVHQKDKLKEFNYERPIEYWLVIIGYAIGYGSFWRFPYLLYSCGGGVFLIPFLLFFFSIAIPLFTLETLLGQVFKKGTVEVYQMIRKKLTGVGWASVVITWLISLYYAIILCWSVYFFFLSFIHPLPWSREANLTKNANNSIYSNASISNNMNISNISTNTNLSTLEEDYINFEYFSKEVLQISQGIENMGSVNGKMAICLFITYILIFLCISKGIKSSSKVVYFTAPVPVILLLILFFKALSLPGITVGLKYLFLPDISKLFDINVWVKASNQAIFMLTLGVGGNILFASYRKDNEDVYQSSFWVPVMTLIFAILCAVINFCYLGHFSYLVNIPIDQLPLTGTGLAFITYPSALCMIPYPNFWSLLFFFMLITLGIDSQFAHNELVSHYIYENFLYKYVTRTNSSIIICFIGFIFGLPFITKGGFYLFELVDNYVTLISCFTISLLQSYAVTRYIGVDVLKEIVANKTGKIIPNYVFFSIKYICPIAHLLLIIFSFHAAVSEKAKYKVLWPYIIQWIIILWPILTILYFMIKYRNEEKVEKNPYIEEMKVIIWSTL